MPTTSGKLAWLRNFKIELFWKFDTNHTREIDPPLDGEWGAVGEDGTFSGRRFRSGFDWF